MYRCIVSNANRIFPTRQENCKSVLKNCAGLYRTSLPGDTVDESEGAEVCTLSPNSFGMVACGKDRISFRGGQARSNVFS